MKHRFDKECKCSSMQISDVSEERKSQPIFSDLETSSDLNRLIRQKYAGDDIVDLVSIAMHWIKNASEKRKWIRISLNSCQLIHFNVYVVVHIRNKLFHVRYFLYVNIQLYST
jgi:hypothetical protein